MEKQRSPAVSVETIAELSKLYLSPQEKEELERNLEDIIQWVGRLREIDTSYAPAMVPGAALANVFREDTLGESLDRELLLSNAPKKREEYIFVPQVIE